MMNIEDGSGGELSGTAGQVQNLSKVAADLLMSEQFEPYFRGNDLVASELADQQNCEIETAAESLAELASAGFIAIEGVNPTSTEPHYQPTLPGRFAAELLRRQRRMRQPALINQQNHKLEDLILAIAFFPHAFNARLPRGMLARDSKVHGHWLQAYLVKWKSDDICAACNALVDGRLLSGKLGVSKGELFGGVELTQRGKRRYSEKVRQQFGLAEQECILDPPPSTLKVFLAWQSEITDARNVLWEVVPKVIDALNSNAGLLRPLKYEMAKEPGEGAIRIDVALQEKIKHADYFIADLTAVYAYGTRLLVNENVLVETGFALASKPPSKIILVEMFDHKVPGAGSQNPQRAFDIGHIHRLRFRDKKEASKKLLEELEAMLTADGWMAPTPAKPSKTRHQSTSQPLA